MTREQFGSRRIAQRAAYHPRVTGPARQGSDMAVGSDTAKRNLADDVQHIISKCPCLLWRHPVRIVFHLQDVTLLDSCPVNHLPEGGEVVRTAVLVVEIISVLPDVEGQ